MKRFFLTAAFAVAIASPALAAPSHHLRSTGAPSAERAYAYAQRDADTVVADGKVLGRDPDVFIRQSLLREGDQANLAGN